MVMAGFHVVIIVMTSVCFAEKTGTNQTEEINPSTESSIYVPENVSLISFSNEEDFDDRSVTKIVVPDDVSFPSNSSKDNFDDGNLTDTTTVLNLGSEEQVSEVDNTPSTAKPVIDGTTEPSVNKQGLQDAETKDKEKAGNNKKREIHPSSESKVVVPDVNFTSNSRKYNFDDGNLTDTTTVHKLDNEEQVSQVDNTPSTTKPVIEGTTEPSVNKQGFQNAGIENKLKDQAREGKRGNLENNENAGKLIKGNIEETKLKDTSQSVTQIKGGNTQTKTIYAPSRKETLPIYNITPPLNYTVTDKSSRNFTITYVLDQTDDEPSKINNKKGKPDNNEDIDSQSNKYPVMIHGKPWKGATTKYLVDGGNYRTNSRTASKQDKQGSSRSATQDRKTDKTNCNNQTEIDTKSQEEFNNEQAAESNGFTLIDNITVITVTPFSETNNMSTTAPTAPLSTTPVGITSSTLRHTNSTAKPPQQPGSGRWKKALNIFGKVTCVSTFIGFAFYLVYSVM